MQKLPVRMLSSWASDQVSGCSREERERERKGQRGQGRGVQGG
jgi:hypothetical protein